jgi:hypothetical protein
MSRATENEDEDPKPSREEMIAMLRMLARGRGATALKAAEKLTAMGESAQEPEQADALRASMFLRTRAPCIRRSGNSVFFSPMTRADAADPMKRGAR